MSFRHWLAGFLRLPCPTCKSMLESAAKLDEMSYKLADGKISAEAFFGGPAVKFFAGVMVGWFKETGGKNYVVCDLNDPKTGERYTVTMQRAGGKTPAQEIGELRAKAGA
jgi:hypothetical protein